MMFKVIIALLLTVAITNTSSVVVAAPYGYGSYSADVPYGSETFLSIATSGDVALDLTPGGGPTTVSAVGTVTVTTTDVLGYKLYIRGLSTQQMTTSTGSTLDASSNVIPGTLAVNTWGYSLDSGTTYAGLTTNDVLLRTTNVPRTAGEVTSITYGANVDNQTAAGAYSVSVIYTAVPQTD